MNSIKTFLAVLAAVLIIAGLWITGYAIALGRVAQ